MSQFASVIKQEITRLSKKEAKRQLAPFRRAIAQHRSQVAALKREIASLRQQLARKSATAAVARPATEGDERPLRFQARGLITERKRLGLSQKDYGRLVGVSGQTILSWEQKKSAPRRAQLLSLASVRGIGKREVAKRLEA